MNLRPDRFYELLARAIDLERERHALKVVGILQGKLLREPRDLRELPTQRFADRRPVFLRILECRSVRRRRMHTSAQEQDALLPANALSHHAENPFYV